MNSNFTALREYLINNIGTIVPDIVFSAKSKRESNNIFTSIYLVEKPEEHELISGNSITIKFNELGGGSPVRHYAVTLRFTSRDISTLYAIRDGLTRALDFFYGDVPIDKMAKFQLSNEGGAYFDDTSKLYSDSLYFDCRLY